MKIYQYPSPAAEKKVSAIVNRGLDFKKKDYQAVSRIIDDVRRNGDDAVIKYANRFDAPSLTVDSIKVTAGEMSAASKIVDRRFVRALNRAASQIEAFHRQQVQQSWIDTRRPGGSNAIRGSSHQKAKEVSNRKAGMFFASNSSCRGWP